MAFKKGQSGNKKGRPPIILPEVQRAVEANRNALKVLTMDKLQKTAGEWVDRIIEQGIGEGDIIRFKTLWEIALGKIIDDAPDFPVSDEEKILILEYRRRKAEELERVKPRTINIP